MECVSIFLYDTVSVGLFVVLLCLAARNQISSLFVRFIDQKMNNKEGKILNMTWGESIKCKNKISVLGYRQYL